MRLSFIEMAHAQKLDFEIFVDEWTEKHEISDYQATLLDIIIHQYGWCFFTDELIEYYLSRPDLYKVYDDTVELLEY